MENLDEKLSRVKSVFDINQIINRKTGLEDIKNITE